jgi:peptidoglycan/xylan/chitin deacetylase (PgdA/CDA1 family)
MKTEDNPDTLIVCITGDIDDFQKETPDCLDRYFTVLHNFNVKGTFFITAKAAEDYPERVEHIVKHHHMVEGHGDVHQAFYESIPIQTDRLKKMKKIFSTLFDLDITGFRAPWYKHNNNTFQAVDNAGLSFDCSKKRFEIAFKGIPFFQKHYMETNAYPICKPALKFLASTYNTYCNSPPIPYRITSSVVEFPTLGISDYTLISDPRGPLYPPEDSEKLGKIWIECLASLKQGGGGVMTLQVHPGRLSPGYVDSLEYFIREGIQLGAIFSTPSEIRDDYIC